ncbi:unnamed protein product [Linum trigynum]|uniref:Uncharacterized protein n=1 Tax=Linum trigynum TaxID=586398 RepID=A0AAV2FSZ8_9ROSI
MRSPEHPQLLFSGEEIKAKIEERRDLRDRTMAVVFDADEGGDAGLAGKRRSSWTNLDSTEIRDFSRMRRGPGERLTWAQRAASRWKTSSLKRTGIDPEHQWAILGRLDSMRIRHMATL